MSRRVFLSYTMDDRPWVARLRAQIGRELPPVNMVDFPVVESTGDDWKTLGDSLLRSCDATLCLVGERTWQSAPVEWELRRSAALGKPVVALLLRSGFKVPEAVHDLRAPVFGWQNRAEGILAAVADESQDA